ncbi:unnamed protein product, partial [Musa hybrid cultivar]
MGQWLLEGILELNSLSMKFHCCRRKLLEYAGACESCYCSNKHAESMIVHPTPSRADVLDIAIAVREGSDPIMLSGETAHGKYLLKAVKVTRTVALRTEATINGGDQPANLCQAFKNHMSEMFGVCPIYMKFSDDAERTFAAEALSSYLQKPGMVKRMVSKLLWFRVGSTSDVEQAGPSKAHSREIGPDLVKPNPFISVSDHHPCLQPWAT